MSKSCIECGKKLSIFTDPFPDICNSCHSTRSQRSEAEQQARDERLQVEERKRIQAERTRDQEVKQLLLTTETTAPDLVVEQRLGIVTAECVIGMHMFKDIAIGIRNTVGGRSETYQNDLRQMRKTVLSELRKEAHGIGANAVIAMDLDYQEIGSKAQSMLMIVASGTAVRLAA